MWNCSSENGGGTVPCTQAPTMDTDQPAPTFFACLLRLYKYIHNSFIYVLLCICTRSYPQLYLLLLLILAGLLIPNRSNSKFQVVLCVRMLIASQEMLRCCGACSVLVANVLPVLLSCAGVVHSPFHLFVHTHVSPTALPIGPLLSFSRSSKARIYVHMIVLLRMYVSGCKQYCIYAACMYLASRKN